MQGSASSGLMYHCGEVGKPPWPAGMVINDYTTGYYGALAVHACLLRRMREGGGYINFPSLTGTAMSILKYFKSERYGELRLAREHALPPEQLVISTKMGIMKTLTPLPKLSKTPIKYNPIFLDPIGSSIPEYPGYEDGYNVEELEPMKKENVGMMMGLSMRKRLNYLRKIGRNELKKSMGVNSELKL
jgi:CoA-transferase family III